MRDGVPEAIKVATLADVEAIDLLLAQLSASAPRFTRADLDAMLADPASTMFAARVGGEIVGITTLVVFRVATGEKAMVDDVVVLEAHRGKGLGEKLVRAAIEHAQSLGVRNIDLTTRPAREAANRLYQRLGFERRETNVYRLTLSGEVLGGR